MNVKKSIPIIVVLALLIGITIEFPVRKKNIISVPELSLISVSPIYIDDLDPDHNWKTFKAQHLWVSGSGTAGDPYEFRRLSIDASEGVYCISVRNSNKFFQIKDSFLFNTDSYGPSAAIKCFNVTFGFVFTTEIYDCRDSGIWGINSSITLLGNRIHNNHGIGIKIEESKACYMQYNRIWNNNKDGIKLNSCINIGIIDNDIFYNDMSGISLWHTNNAQIVVNNVYDNEHGMCLVKSSDNLIERNSIYSNRECGIHLSNESNRTYIEGNSIYDNRYCISLGSSCSGTTGNNMDSCDINYIDENPSSSSNKDFTFPDFINISGYTFPLIYIAISSILVCFFIIVDHIKIPRNHNKK